MHSVPAPPSAVRQFWRAPYGCGLPNGYRAGVSDDHSHWDSGRVRHRPGGSSSLLDRSSGFRFERRSADDGRGAVARGGPPGGDSSLVLYPTALMEDWDERKPSVVFVTDDVERTCERLATNGVTSQPVVE